MENFKKNGLNQLRTRFWFRRVFVASGKSNIKQLAESYSGKDSNTSTQWKDYQQGKKVPRVYLKIVENELGITTDDFVNGPSLLLRAMEEPRLQDVVSILLNELDEFFVVKGLPTLAESGGGPETYEERIKWLIGRGKRLYELRSVTDVGNEIIPLAMAFGHVESRMLGNTGSMKDYIVESLNYFDTNFSIPPEAWCFDADICDSIKARLVDINLDIVFKLKSPASHSLFLKTKKFCESLLN